MSVSIRCVDRTLKKLPTWPACLPACVSGSLTNLSLLEKSRIDLRCRPGHGSQQVPRLAAVPNNNVLRGRVAAITLPSYRAQHRSAKMSCLIHSAFREGVVARRRWCVHAGRCDVSRKATPTSHTFPPFIYPLDEPNIYRLPFM